MFDFGKYFLIKKCEPFFQGALLVIRLVSGLRTYLSIQVKEKEYIKVGGGFSVSDSSPLCVSRDYHSRAPRIGRRLSLGASPWSSTWPSGRTVPCHPCRRWENFVSLKTDFVSLKPDFSASAFRIFRPRLVAYWLINGATKHF